MNLHFIYFLIDIIFLIIIEVLFCSQIFVEKPNRVKLSKFTILSIFILSIFSGFFSVLVHGIPNLGFSINSIVYASIAPFGLILFMQTRQKKLILKYSK